MAPPTSPEEIEKIRDQVKNFFVRNYNVQFIRSVGDGSHGGTALFREVLPGTGETRRNIVVKFSLAASEDHQLLNELHWIPRIGTEHIIDIIALSEIAKKQREGLQGVADEDLARELELLLDMMNADDEPEPLMILEYMPHGNLHELRNRFIQAGIPVPQPLLWRIGLCLARAIVGMAYYNDIEPGARETIPVGVTPSTLCHHSMKALNVVVGDGMPDDVEHKISPLVKLIDFGRATLDVPANYPDTHANPEGHGVEQNVWGWANIMQTLACPFVPLKGQLSFLTADSNDLIHRGRVWTTSARREFLENADVSDKFKLLTGKCLAVQGDDMVSLSRLLTTCEKMVNHPLSDDEEQAIENVFQEVVLNAPSS